MLSHWLKCRKNTESKNPKFVQENKGRIMLSSKCAVSDSKKLRFIKQKEASGLISKFRSKAYVSEIPLLGDIFF